MICKFLLLITALAGGISYAAPANPAGAPVEIVKAEFGIFDASNPRQMVFEPANVVPHRVGQRYGWVIDVRTTKPYLSVREEYLLPSTTSTQNIENPYSEVLDKATGRRNQVSQRQLTPVDGKIYGEWAVGPSEPAGHRHLQVVIEGQVAASFEFDVK